MSLQEIEAKYDGIRRTYIRYVPRWVTIAQLEVSAAIRRDYRRCLAVLRR